MIKSRQSLPKYLLNVVLGTVLGCVVCLLATSLFYGLPVVIEIVAAPFLFVPDQLGLIQRLGKDEVVTVSFVASQTPTVQIAESGRHIVYSATPWTVEKIIVRHLETGQQIEPSPIYSENIAEVECQVTAIKPLFDACVPNPESMAVRETGSSLFLPAERAFEFSVEQPGMYEISIKGSGEGDQMLYIVPDYVSANRRVFFLSLLLHAAAIGLIVGAVYYQRNKDNIRSRKATRREKRGQFDEWMKERKE